MKVCTNKKCEFGGVPQQPEDFYRHRGYADGRQQECKRCQNKKRNQRKLKDKNDWMRIIIG